CGIADSGWGILGKCSPGRLKTVRDAVEKNNSPCRKQSCYKSNQKNLAGGNSIHNGVPSLKLWIPAKCGDRGRKMLAKRVPLRGDCTNAGRWRRVSFSTRRIVKEK